MTRAADDFAVIGEILKKLTEVPEPKRSGSGAAWQHCSHCPKEPDEHCSASCAAEAEKAGIVALVEKSGKPNGGRYWCPKCMSHRTIWCGGSDCLDSGLPSGVDRIHVSALGAGWNVPSYYNGIFIESLVPRGQLGLVAFLEADPEHVYSYRGIGVSPQEFAKDVRAMARRFGVVC